MTGRSSIGQLSIDVSAIGVRFRRPSPRARRPPIMTRPLVPTRLTINCRADKFSPRAPTSPRVGTDVSERATRLRATRLGATRPTPRLPAGDKQGARQRCKPRESGGRCEKASDLTAQHGYDYIRLTWMLCIFVCIFISANFSSALHSLLLSVICRSCIILYSSISLDLPFIIISSFAIHPSLSYCHLHHSLILCYPSLSHPLPFVFSPFPLPSIFLSRALPPPGSSPVADLFVFIRWRWRLASGGRST